MIENLIVFTLVAIASGWTVWSLVQSLKNGKCASCKDCPSGKDCSACASQSCDGAGACKCQCGKSDKNENEDENKEDKDKDTEMMENVKNTEETSVVS
ncbi:MAG: FeoB-associated Cys-rich membrane protein [Planctomycetia bacterium]|nr:FeoB-associated Cys-rich membrane protein [Planctomycetia bacterium]